MRKYRHVLDISEDASEEQIKAHYKVLVRIFHPDRHTDPAVKVYAERRLKEINEAYRALLNGDEGEPTNNEVSTASARPLPGGWQRLAHQIAHNSTYRRTATFLGIALFLILCSSVVWLSISAAWALSQLSGSTRPSLLLPAQTPTMLPTQPKPTATMVFIAQTANFSATLLPTIAPTIPTATDTPAATNTPLPTTTETPVPTSTPLPTATPSVAAAPSQPAIATDPAPNAALAAVVPPIATVPQPTVPQPTVPQPTIAPPPTQQPPPAVLNPATSSLQPIHDGVIVTIANRLNANARSDTSTNSQALALLLYGTSVEAVGRTVDSSWLRVVLPDGRLGWIFAALVSAPAGQIAQLPILYTTPQQ